MRGHHTIRLVRRHAGDRPVIDTEHATGALDATDDLIFIEQVTGGFQAGDGAVEERVVRIPELERINGDLLDTERLFGCGRREGFSLFPISRPLGSMK